KELLNRIKDIRSSEKVLYRQVLDLYATSIDYDPKSEITQKFFAIVQNKLHYAANGKTAAEIIAERANAEKPFMGLLTFGKNGVRKSDIAIAKNYLTEIEIKKLNNVVSAYFDIAELRALDEKPTSMQDYINNLDKLIVSMDRNVLKESGKISHVEAEFKAISEYSKYQQKILSSVEKDYLDNINQLEKKVQKTLKSYNPKTK
ncbi:MAG: virulence RhuM family protein, partial [Sediminibacterium sp.]|nr:virulence RhuM family protein [Sediminibacterium sp.]